MPTWSTRYVRLRDRRVDLDRLKRLSAPEAHALIHAEEGSPYAASTVQTSVLVPDDLSELSRTFSEAFSVQVHSVADLVIYDHFREGERTRGLSYAGEAGWVRVVGAPEAWETGFFFAPEKLQHLLHELQDDFSDEAVLARDTAEIKRLFAAAELEEGNTRPVTHWRAFAQAIARHYGFADPVPSSASSTRIPQVKPKS